jgi:hypothetical protein
MSSPSLGQTKPRLPTSITSALDVSQSSARRRVSGPYRAPSQDVASTGSLGATGEENRYANPFDDVYKVVQQQKLPALGRELFSDDEDTNEARAPPPAVPDSLHQARSLPPIPPESSQSSYPSPRVQEETITRLPTPNFAAIHEDERRAHDIDSRLGLFFKLTQPFRTLRAISRPGVTVSNKADDEAAGSNNAATVAKRMAGLTNPIDKYALAPDPAPDFPCTDLSRRDTAASGQTRTSALSIPSDAATVRLIGTEPLSRRTTKSARFLDVPGENYDDDGAESDGTSSTEALLSRQPPRSPALLAATHAATDRFTRRFPVSMSYQKANGKKGEPDDQHLLGLLGYGETGTVVEWPNAWTPEKWSLLFSVCSVS